MAPTSDSSLHSALTTPTPSSLRGGWRDLGVLPEVHPPSWSELENGSARSDTHLFAVRPAMAELRLVPASTGRPRVWRRRQTCDGRARSPELHHCGCSCTRYCSPPMDARVRSHSPGEAVQDISVSARVRGWETQTLGLGTTSLLPCRRVPHNDGSRAFVRPPARLMVERRPEPPRTSVATTASSHK